jgi:hypothetical protein
MHFFDLSARILSALIRANSAAAGSSARNVVQEFQILETMVAVAFMFYPI